MAAACATTDDTHDPGEPCGRSRWSSSALLVPLEGQRMGEEFGQGVAHVVPFTAARRSG